MALNTTEVDGVDPAKLGVVALSGPAAVEAVYGHDDSDTEDQKSEGCDLPRARAYAQAMTDDPIEVERLLVAWGAEARVLLKKPGALEVIGFVSTELRSRGRLTGEDIQELCSRVPDFG